MAEASGLLAGPDRAQAGHQPEPTGLQAGQAGVQAGVLGAVTPASGGDQTGGEERVRGAGEGVSEKLRSPGKRGAGRGGEGEAGTAGVEAGDDAAEAGCR